MWYKNEKSGEETKGLSLRENLPMHLERWGPPDQLPLSPHSLKISLTVSLCYFVTTMGIIRSASLTLGVSRDQPHIHPVPYYLFDLEGGGAPRPAYLIPALPRDQSHIHPLPNNYFDLERWAPWGPPRTASTNPESRKIIRRRTLCKTITLILNLQRSASMIPEPRN